MPTFAYTARDASGAAANGSLVALSIIEVGKTLRAEGKYPTSIRESEDPAARVVIAARIGPQGIKIPRPQVIQISQQLAIMLETGVTISDALDCIAQQTIDPKIKALVSGLSGDVQGGTDFSAALQKHPRSFPMLYIALIRASEKSGMMGKLLLRATNYLRDEAEIIRRVRGALTYPAIMLAFATSTTLFLLTFVLPKFTAIYAQKGAALPVPTKILMLVSNGLISHWLLAISGLSIVTISAFMYGRTDSGRRTLHRLQLGIPLIGPLFKKMHLARGLRMVGTMSAAGINLVDAVATAHDLCPNTCYKQLWLKVQDQITAGKQLSEPLFTSRLVPRSVAQMIHSGEKSGKLAFVMEQVSTFSEKELKETITELTRFIEPAMIAVMGLIIGSITLALMLPIFTISKVLAH